MLMSATKIVIKYHFKIHSICICKAHLLSCKIHGAVHHVFSLEFVAVIFLVVIIIQLLKWNLMSGPDLHRARKPSVLQQQQGCFGASFRGFERLFVLDSHWFFWTTVLFSLTCAPVDDRQWKDLEVSLRCWCSPLQTPCCTIPHQKAAQQAVRSWYMRGMLNGLLLNVVPVWISGRTRVCWMLCKNLLEDAAMQKT